MAVYAEYSEIVNTVVGVKTVGQSINICLAGAAIVILGGVGCVISGYMTKINPKMNNIFMGSLLVVAVGGIIELAGGVVVKSHPYYTTISDFTIESNQALVGQQLSGERLSMMHFGLALFDQCCSPNQWKSQEVLTAQQCNTTCPGASYGDRGYFIDARINLIVGAVPASFLQRLCTCVVNADLPVVYPTIKAKVTPAMCKKLESMTVPFANYEIPTTRANGSPLSLGTALGLAFLGVTIPVKSVPLIGYQLFNITSPPTTTGFGCGLGYSKGIMWMQQLWHDEYLMKGANACVGMGAASFVSVIFIFALGWFLAKEDSDFKDNGNWQNTLAANWNDPSNNPTVMAVVAPSAMPSVSNGPAGAGYGMSSAVVMNSGGGGGTGDFNDRMYKFYAHYDPMKSSAEIQNIAAWGKQNGEQALNKKLRDKYGVDLTGTRSGQAGGGPPI